MFIDSPVIMGGVFQRCRHARSDSGELLALLSDILTEVDKQGKLLIEVPDGLVPDKWVKAVGADTRRGIEYINAMELWEYDGLNPSNRPSLAIIQLLVKELQRLWSTEAIEAVKHLGYAFHNVARDFRPPRELGSEWAMMYFRIISSKWEELSTEMREDCCRIVGLDVGAAEARIKTPGFSLRAWPGSMLHR